ncbi:hypothetical protein T11_14385 [Trichinella zimbabwensis]|uniref:Zinc finger BED domain-containing protein 5 n=1 Tax=Trichinella zimbabwensis TaxID=268475 RepID=A0A0V1HIB5_9BILA|nr:hypothetical protein T11_14385 [Trichinella zimbabwensis]
MITRKFLRDEKFVLKLTYLADIFSVHDKIRGYTKTLFMEKNVEDGNYYCFETLATFIVEEEVTLAEHLISMIAAHPESLKESFDYYFSEETKLSGLGIRFRVLLWLPAYRRRQMNN